MKLLYPILLAAVAVSTASFGGALTGETLAPILVIPAFAWLGLSLGVRLRPSLGGLRQAHRGPTSSEAAGLALGLVAAFLTLAAMAEFWTLLRTIARETELTTREIIGPVFGLFVYALPIAPLWRRALDAAPDGARPLSPLATGLCAIAPLGLGMGILWMSAVEPMTESIIPRATGLFALLSAPAAVLCLGLGGGFIGAAYADRATSKTFLRPAVRAAQATWLIAAIIVALALIDIPIPMIGRLTSAGGDYPRVFGLIAAMSWGAALWRMRDIETSGPMRAFAGAVILVLAFVISLWASRAMVDTDWKGLVAFVITPFALATHAACIFAIPWLVRRAARSSPVPRPAPSDFHPSSWAH